MGEKGSVDQAPVDPNEVAQEVHNHGDCGMPCQVYGAESLPPKKDGEADQIAEMSATKESIQEKQSQGSPVKIKKLHTL
jgi:hypothetical protein